jgi:isopentenyl phosphate kinase
LPERVFVKLGGSAITDKTRDQAARRDVIARAAREIAAARAARPDLALVLGHGSGSFGHVSAARYGVRAGCGEDWTGYALTGAAAARLNRIVTDALLDAGVPAVSLQASASARCRDGVLETLADEPVEVLLAHGLTPLVYGDVALDAVRGCTIVSTEQILAHLAPRLRPRRIVMVGDVEGVFTADPRRDPAARLIPEIRAGEYAAVDGALSASHGVDVTGGMRDKVRTLCTLVSEVPGLTVRLITARTPGLIERVLCDETVSEGTLIRP